VNVQDSPGDRGDDDAAGQIEFDPRKFGLGRLHVAGCDHDVGLIVDLRG